MVNEQRSARLAPGSRGPYQFAFPLSLDEEGMALLLFDNRQVGVRPVAAHERGRHLTE